jgi:hypothetical protein
MILIATSALNLFSSSPSISYAQSAIIETSTDDHDGRFFGGLLQVVIEDADTSDEDDTIDVDITVEEDGGNVASGTFTIDDTSDGSQRFEFFIVHPDSDDVSPDDPIGVTATMITFGDGAPDLDVPDFELYDTGSIEIQYGDHIVTIDYDETSAELTADRGVYGSTSLVHLFIIDQDGNLDPTAVDSFNVIEADLGFLFEATGAQFVDDITFEETGDNTAQFEAVLQLSSSDSAEEPELVFTEDILTMMLRDMVNYNDAGFDNPENDSTDTSEVSFEIDDGDGNIDELADLTFSSELVVAIRDDDQNLDSEEEDLIRGALFAEVDNSGGDSETLDLVESSDNTGVFEIDLANAELRITFLEDGASPTPDNGILEFRAEDIAHDIIIGYIDPLSDNSQQEVVAEIVVVLDIMDGIVDLPDSASMNENFVLTILDNDLNDNLRIRDTYVIMLDGGGPYPLTRGGSVYGEIGQFEVRFNGNTLNFETPVVVTLIETAVGSGEFTSGLAVAELLANAGVEAQDGDELEITYFDLMGEVPSESSDTLIIGTPNPPTPVEMFGELIEQATENNVDTSVLKQATKLLQDNNHNNDRAVCGLLEAFSHQVQSQAGKKITEDLAEELQTKAADIKQQIGC